MLYALVTSNCDEEWTFLKTLNCPKLWYTNINILYLLFVVDQHIYTDFIFLVVIIHAVVAVKLYSFY